MSENTNLDVIDTKEQKLEIEESEEEKYTLPSGVYQNYDSKASENKSSAISLLIVGIIGAIVVALSWFERLPFSIGGSRNLMSHSVLFVFFVIFIILGIVSALNVKKYKNMLHEEQSTKNAIYDYLKANFTKEYLEEISEETDEEAYFNRMNVMRERFKENFEDKEYDETLLEALLDEYYDEVFG